MIGYDYAIKYQSGKSNTATNALPPIPKPSTRKLLMLTLPNFTFLQDPKHELDLYLDFVAFHKAIKNNPQDHPNCIIVHNLILQKGCIWLPKGLCFIQTLLKKFHSMPTGGHMGITKTLTSVG